MQAVRLLYGCTIFCGSALLFLIQPIMARRILPWFGGSAGVWAACMLFFQALLLAGYVYANWAARGRNLVHLGLLTVSLLALPVRASEAWKPVGGEEPVFRILGLLLVSVGLPYFLLASNSPLVQSWYPGLPWRLFALSNGASLSGLLAYPVLIEPLMPLKAQLLTWSAAYAIFVVLAGVVTVLGSRTPLPHGIGQAKPPAPLWLALAACPSILWLAVANHLSRDVAPIPFLWILPLSLYLLSFILCFESGAWYRPGTFRWLLPLAWIAMAAGYGAGIGIRSSILLFTMALFICCMFCHGELARLKPAGDVTGFYPWIALGGAAGAVFVGLAAPHLFRDYLELPIGVAGCILLALPLLYGYRSPARLARLGALLVIALLAGTQLRGPRQRNFHGTLLVKDAGGTRFLYSGTVEHGAQFLAPDRSRLATAYYGPESGAAQAIRLSQRRPAVRVGVIGLGAGTLAAYGRPGDYFRFYELNPLVIRIAASDFRFLRESPARIDVIPGDGRLSLEREPAGQFDALIVDAFSSDSIPVHLLTREAFQLYSRHLTPEGIIAVHVTNKYLDLAPVVGAQARALGKEATVVENRADPPREIRQASWVLVRPGASAIPATRPWTDDYSNLFRALR